MAFLTTQSEVLWLNITNGALGAVVLICLLIVAGAVIYQFAGAARERARNVRAAGDLDALLGDHAFHTPGLGVTMADGGERTDKKAQR